MKVPKPQNRASHPEWQPDVASPGLLALTILSGGAVCVLMAVFILYWAAKATGLL